MAALQNSCNVRYACQAAGISRATAYREADKNPKFREAWETALEEAVDVLEYEAFKRATKGAQQVEPVYFQGKKVGEKITTFYSDGLLQFLLKGRRAEIYGDRQKIEAAMTGTLGVTVIPEPPKTVEEWLELVNKQQTQEKE